MAKKRGLGAKRGLEALLSGTKVGRQVVDVIDDAKATLAQPSDYSTQEQITAEVPTAMANPQQSSAQISDNQPADVEQSDDMAAYQNLDNHHADMAAERGDIMAAHELCEYQRREIALFWQFGLADAQQN
ncbi:hypothetical protein [Moraxella cuniculi]|uniref:Uncharacterized protein n=1 Tax=Moraxella cuniculi TaxID=34061 RepID=A0A3S5EFZ6_9GAMM|nr:hypothetical protein [Moraxella cuniculi]VEG13525.1 Uncharacterised protein [Moraxella cuniculi]